MMGQAQAPIYAKKSKLFLTPHNEVKTKSIYDNESIVCHKCFCVASDNSFLIVMN